MTPHKHPAHASFMTTPDSLTRPADPLMQEALNWILRLTSGAATHADAQAFARWRAQGPAHEAAFREAAAFRKAVRAMDLPHPSANVVALRPKDRNVNRRYVLAGGAVAASAAGALLVNPPFDLWPRAEELMAGHRTGAGERRRISLSEGASIELNARSALSVTDTGAGVNLVEGEAFLSLPQTSTPFRVRLRGERFTTLGGDFNLRTSARESCLTCLSGSINAGALSLKTGEQYMRAPNASARIAEVETARVAGWREGRLIFRNTPLAEALEDINRYRSGRIILADGTLANRPVNGVFHTDQVENAVKQLEVLLGIRAKYLPGNVVLLG